MDKVKEVKYLQEKGYRIRKTTDGPTKIVERKWLVKIPYKPPNKVKAISLEQVNSVILYFPLVGTLIRLVWRFKEIL